MSDRAKRVLDALIESNTDEGIRYPITAIVDFFYDINDVDVNRDYQALNSEEEKQIIKALLEIEY